MIKLNLMPWRHELRLQKNREFAAICFLFAIMAVGLVLVLNFFIDQNIQTQKTRNSYLQSQLDLLADEILKIQKIEERKASLISSIEVITTLETSRPLSIHLMEQLVLTLPNGMWLSSVEQQNKKIQIKARSTDDALVSTYLRNLSKSYWFDQVMLKSIQRPTEGEIITVEVDFSLNESVQETKGG